MSAGALALVLVAQAVPPPSAAKPKLPSVEGRVIDENGEPVMGCQATLFVSSNSVAVWGAQTDDLGRFYIGGIRPGTYVLEVRANRAPVRPRPFGPASSGSMDAAYPKIWYPASPTIEGAKQFVLNDGDHVKGLEVRLAAASAVTVSGEVKGIELTPQSRIFARLLSLTTPHSPQVATAPVLSSGQFRFSNIPAGSYRIALVSLMAQAEELKHYARVDIEVRDQPLTDLVVEAKPTFRVDLRVEPAELASNLDQLGLRSLSEPGGNFVRANRSNVPGMFSFLGLQPGTYALTGMPPFPTKLDGRAVDSQSIELTGKGELVVTLQPPSSNP